jgi:hypothetical protein
MPLMLNWNLAPGTNETVPVDRGAVPGLPPGDKVAPEVTDSGPTLPLPARIPAETETARLLLDEPVRVSVPPLDWSGSPIR